MWEASPFLPFHQKLSQRHSFPFSVYSFLYCLGPMLSQSFCCCWHWMNLHSPWDVQALFQRIHHFSTLFCSKCFANYFSLLVCSKISERVPPPLSAHEKRKIYIRICCNKWRHVEEKQILHTVTWWYCSFSDNTISPADDHED